MTIVLLEELHDDIARWKVKVPVPPRLCPVVGVKTLTRTLQGRRSDAEALEAQLRSDLQRGRARRRSGPKLPFAPLEQALGPLSVAALARELDVLPRYIYRYRARGVSVQLADQLATTAGLHPSDVWTEWWTIDDQATEDAWIAARFDELEERIEQLTRLVDKLWDARRAA
jgi:hypothetical protein